MKLQNFFLSLFIFSLLFTPNTTIYAEIPITPDIRTSNIYVNTRKMPTTCGSLEWWISQYVGKNAIVQNEIKFYSDLTPDANQLDKTTIRLTPYSVRNNMLTPKDETGNKPSWNASICYYTDGGSGQIPSNELIITEKSVPVATKKLRWGSELLAAMLARAHVPLEGQQYNMKKEDIAPNTETPRSCAESPPGVGQYDKTDLNTGINIFNFNFVNDWTLDRMCAGNACNCVKTEMWIKPDSTNQYASYVGCSDAGCKNKNGVQQAVLGIDQKSRADENAIDSGGIANIFRPGMMLPIFEFVEMIIGHSAGVVAKQKTINNKGEREENASWSFTKEWEVSADFKNCKLFPYAKRSEMKECNTKWLDKIIGNIVDQLKPSATPIPSPAPSPTPKPPTPTPTLSIPPSTSGLHGKCEGNMPATADAFITYLYDHGIFWPDYDNIRAHYEEILQASKIKGIDPGIVIAIWVEESGAGRAGPQFGCTKVDHIFQTQLECFLNLWDTYATRKDFTECRGSDNTLDLREFMLIYEGGFKSCRSGQFGTEPTFPEKLKDWYDKLTDCQNGLEF